MSTLFNANVLSSCHFTSDQTEYRDTGTTTEDTWADQCCLQLLNDAGNVKLHGNKRVHH